MDLVTQLLGGQLLQVGNPAHHDHGKLPQVGVDDDRLGIGVADHAQAHSALKTVQAGFKFGTEIGIFQTVDGPVEAALPVGDQPAPLGSQMGQVICPVK